MSAWEGLARPPDPARFLRNVAEQQRSSGPCGDPLDVPCKLCVHEHLMDAELGEAIREGTAAGAPPTWFLAASMLGLLNKECLSRILEDPSDAGIALIGKLAMNFDPSGVYTLLRRCCTDIRVPKVYRQLALLHPLPIIVTTNFDRGLEKALSAHLHAGVQTISTDHDLIFSSPLFTPIIQLHGGLADAPNVGGHSPSPGVRLEHLSPGAARKAMKNLVLTDDQYWNFPEGRRLLVSYLQVLLATRKVVFLGYSLADFNVLEQLHNLAPYVEWMEPPLLITNDSSDLHAVRWKSRGVEVVACDHTEFLARVSKELIGLSLEQWESVLPPELEATPGYDDTRTAVRLLKHLCDNDPQRDRFANVMRKAIAYPLFDRDLLESCEAWKVDDSTRTPLFLAKKWLRPFDMGESPMQANYLEFSMNIRAEMMNLLRHI